MEPALLIEGLRKKFGEFTAVDGLDLSIRRNEIFGFLGPNGAGKTTTISMICGLMPPSEGKITFFPPPGKDLHPQIGYCTQENIIYPKLTCSEQLIFIGRMYGIPRKEIISKAKKFLGLLGLDEKADILAGKLSGGMKRRLNICLALMHEPEILILDEPEAGLDPQSRILVREFIRDYGHKKTVLLTTHNMDEADRLADRIAIIDHGKLLLADTPRNLKKTIGEGDILEIIVQSGSEKNLALFAENELLQKMQIKTGSNSILLKQPGIVDQLPAIKMLADQSGLTIAEIRLRENSLEDVFLHLTGRHLRE